MSKYAAWIFKHQPAAEAAVKGTGLFSQVLLAQAILESAKNGKMPGTELAKKYNNYFGIKAFKSWKGDRVNFKTGEFTPAGSAYTMQSDFRAYKTPLDSFKDYVKLMQSPRYKNVLKARTVADQAKAIKAAGYSTNPKYATDVANMANVIQKALGKAATVIKENKPASAGILLGVAGAIYLLSKTKSNGNK